MLFVGAGKWWCIWTVMLTVVQRKIITYCTNERPTVGPAFTWSNNNSWQWIEPWRYCLRNLQHQQLSLPILWISVGSGAVGAVASVNFQFNDADWNNVSLFHQYDLSLRQWIAVQHVTVTHSVLITHHSHSAEISTLSFSILYVADRNMTLFLLINNS